MRNLLVGYRPENGYSTRKKVTLARNTGDLNFLNDEAGYFGDAQ
jgi:hypothetical protein